MEPAPFHIGAVDEEARGHLPSEYSYRDENPCLPKMPVSTAHRHRPM